MFLQRALEIKKIKQLVIHITAGCFIFFISCKTKQANTSKTPADDSSANSISTKGIVSHQYKSQGCETVIICNPINKNDTLFLIPATPLEKFDVDGLKISFTYRILRIHNPKGCHQGIPAQISNIKQY